MLDLDRLRALARGENPKPARGTRVAHLAPVAAGRKLPAARSATCAATGLSHCSYKATGATGEICKDPRERHRQPVAAHVAIRSGASPLAEIDQVEREAIAIELGGVPEAYASAFAQLQAHAPPEVPLERWHQFINDAGIFLDQWGRDAERLGWSVDDLFGLHPNAPMARYDRMGLLWMLKGQRVVALTGRGAKLSGGLTFYRKC